MTALPRHISSKPHHLAPSDTDTTKFLRPTMSIYIRCIIAAIFAQCLTSLAENHKTWSLETDPTPEGFKIIRSMTGIQVRYKEHENNSICETTPGVRSFAGFIDLAEDSHTWFWFFESRNDPVNDPITFWTNGGPGSDSNIGLFQGTYKLIDCAKGFLADSC
jgi:hypothetical protein